MKGVISRSYYPNETRGSFLILEGQELVWQCKCIEPPDLGNQRNISCIPEGEYWAIKHTREDGKVVFLLLDVPGRDGIEIHIGNYVQGSHPDTRGCILPGIEFTDANADGFIDITNSTFAMNRLLSILPDKFKIHVL